MTDERVWTGVERCPDQEAPDADARRRVVVGILADPDLPASIARRFPDVLPALLAQQVSDRVTWVVEVVCEPFEAMVPTPAG